MTHARVPPPSACSICATRIDSWLYDADGGLLVLFACGGTRYWSRGELLAHSSPEIPTLDCRGTPLPRFFLDHRWASLRASHPSPERL